MAEPLLDLGDIGLVRKRVGGGRCAQGVHAEPVYFGADTGLQPIFPHNISIDGSGVERAIELPRPVVRHRTKHGPGRIGSVAGERKVFLN